MSKPRGEGAWWRAAGPRRTWVTSSEPSPGDNSGQRGSTHLRGIHLPGHGRAPVGSTTGITAGTPAGAQAGSNAGMDSLIDGVLGDSHTTVLERSAVAAPARPRGPIEWPPRTPTQQGGITFTRPPGTLSRVSARLRPAGHWTYTGMRSRTRVVVVLLVTGALVLAAVLTTRALATSASTNFSGVLTAASPIQLNFPQAGTITSIDVSPGQTVQVGQVIATQQNTALAQQVVSDHVALASDLQRLGELLGPAAKVTLAQATVAYNKSQSEAAVSEARGATAVAQGQGRLQAAQSQLSSANVQLAADNQSYASRCSKGLGESGCAALNRLVQLDQGAVATDTARVQTAQAALTAAEGIDATLASIATSELNIAAHINPSISASLAVEISAARDAIAHDQAQLANDIAALNGATIVAPAAGIVVSVNGTPGEIAGGGGTRTGSSSGSALPGSQTSGSSPGPSSVSGSSSGVQPLVTIDANPGLEAIAQVPEAYISQIYLGEPATVTVDALGGHSYVGRVLLKEPAPVNVQGTVFYDVVIGPAGPTWPTASLLPGMTANITIG